jgi:hypothetical protein
MNRFSDFNIDTGSDIFDGKKINFSDLFNIPIIVKAYKIEKSKYTGKNKSNNRLTLAIVYNNENRIAFTGSDNLMEIIKKVPEDKFPFETVIKKNDKKFTFS